MRGLKILIGVVTFAAMLWVWPVHPFREVISVRSGDEGHALTEPIGIGENISQHFKAADNNLIQIEFVVSLDDTLPREGEILFELLDRNGEALYSQNLNYADMRDYTYGGPVVNVRVKRGGQYVYRLTNLNISENQPRGVYTGDRNMYCLKKGVLEVSGQQVQGELLTRVTTNSPLNAANTLAIWGCIGMVGFTLLECLERVERKRKDN